MNRVLVTGAGGFLGGVLCDVLADIGTNIVAQQRKPAKVRWPLATTIISDLRAPTALSAVPEVDTIFHCAARRPSSYNDVEAAENNRRVDDTVLKLAEERRLDLIYASMATLYGMGKRCLPGPATQTQAGIYPFEKARTEQSGFEQAARLGMRFSSLRINAPYGPHQLGRTVMQVFIHNALDRQPLKYHGSGTRQQDFTFARDVAEAFVAAKRSPSGYYLISGGAPVSMRDLAVLVCDVAGVPKSLVQPSGQPDPQEGFAAQFDISDAARVLGWRPRTTLRAGIEACIAARRTA